MALDPWYKVALPREEVREGRSFNPDEFAIALEQVVAGTAPADHVVGDDAGDAVRRRQDPHADGAGADPLLADLRQILDDLQLGDRVRIDVE